MNRRVRALLAGIVLWLLVQVPVSLFSSPDRIEIICRKSYYTPDVIRLKKGVPVEIVLRSEDVTHGFAVDEFGIAREVAPGPPVVIPLTPDRIGTFSFYCVVRCGKDHLKMRGTLIIEE